MQQIESPCIENCCLDDEDVCLGCFRTVEEIMHWGSANAIEREAILERARSRKKIRVGD